jgi:CysZ protein
MFSFFKGMLDCGAGFSLMLGKGVRRFVIVPLIINIVLFAVAVYYFVARASAWARDLLPGWLAFLDIIIVPLLVIMAALIVFYSFTLLANLIAAPFNSLLAARVEALLTGTTPQDINSDKFYKLVIRSTGAELKKMLYFIKWLIPLLVITVIPGINVIAPLAWFVYAAWSFSLEYMDYPLANRGQLFTDIRDFNRKQRMRTLGFGSVVFVMTSIPVLNFFAMPVAVCGATRLAVRTGVNAA